MATSDAREARRRRILDRGADRFALITDRIQSLPTRPSESYHSHTTSCPPSIAEVSPQVENEGRISPFPKNDRGSQFSEINKVDGGSEIGPVVRKCQTINEANRASLFEFDGNARPSLATSAVQNSSFSASGRDLHSEPQNRTFFTPKQISSATAATERIRISCSLAAAVLVILSYVGFPIIGSHLMNNLVFTKPLYLLLLTNISIVLAHLLLEKPKSSAKAKQHRSVVSPAGGHDLADHVGKALESGLVLQSVVGALFMDSSVYAAVVVCGISLAQRFGW